MNWRKAILPAFIMASLLLAAQYTVLRSPGRWEFALHRARYNSLVQEINAWNVSPGGHASLRLGASLDPRSLGKDHGGDTMTGIIFVERSPEGRLRFSVITRDEGHSGAYGYIYTEETTPPGACGNLLTVREQVEPHWFIAYNDQL